MLTEKKIFPAPEGALPDRYTGFADDIAEYPAFARRKPNLGLYDIPTLPKGLMGLEEIRRIDLEDWMDEKQLDAVIFPAVADVAPADADQMRLQRILLGVMEFGLLMET